MLTCLERHGTGETRAIAVATEPMPLLRVEDVSWSTRRAGRAANVLRDVSLELDEGALAGLCGPRGSGKSTLAAIVAGRRAPDTGAVLLDDAPLGDATRGQVGLADGRGPELEDMTALTWIASGLVDATSWRAARRRAWTAVDRVGLGTAASLRWPELAARERMLAALAQAIARGPRLLVVDGPLSEMGAEERAAVLDLLRAFVDDGVAVLATATDAGDLAGFDPVWTLEDGALQGPPPRPVATVIPLRAHHPPRGQEA